MFWEHTPFSSVTLSRHKLPLSSGASCFRRRCASTYTATLQTLLWWIPKIIAFVMITGLHYQLLWYLARVFLPSRRTSCRLAALIRPDQYTDILTQKELRKFTSGLLNSRKRSGSIHTMGAY